MHDYQDQGHSYQGLRRDKQRVDRALMRMVRAPYLELGPPPLTYKRGFLLRHDVVASLGRRGQSLRNVVVSRKGVARRSSPRGHAQHAAT